MSQSFSNVRINLKQLLACELIFTLLFMMARMHNMQTWISSFASPIFRRATCRDLLLTPGLSLSSWRGGLKHPLFNGEVSVPAVLLYNIITDLLFLKSTISQFVVRTLVTNYFIYTIFNHLYINVLNYLDFLFKKWTFIKKERKREFFYLQKYFPRIVMWSLIILL